jgi:hypothetical protein
MSSAVSERFIANFLPSSARLGGILATQYTSGGGQQTKNHSGLFVCEAGFDNESTELDLAPGIEPAIGVSYPLHLTSVPP